MKKIAAQGLVDEESVIGYIVDGLDIKTEYKFGLYGCKTYQELKEKFVTYERKCSNESQNKPYSGSKKNMFVAKSTRCFNCGSVDHMRKDCKAETKCFKCEGTGHISKNCPETTKSLNVVKEDKRLKVVLLNDVEVACLDDTGSDVTIIRQCVFEKLADVALEKSHSVLRGLVNSKTIPLGMFVGVVRVDGIITDQKIVVVPDHNIANDGLLGFDFASKFCLTLHEGEFSFSEASARPNTAEQNELSIYNIFEDGNNINAPPQFVPLIESIISGYKTVASPVECPVQMKILPDSQMKPFGHQPSRCSPGQSDVVKQQVDEWLQEGIVRKSTSNFASRVVLVKKKDGTTRVCVDFRQLNTMVLKTASLCR
ncbi:hypothetical protein ACLKA6_002311 [Drosophila palustris]